MKKILTSIGNNLLNEKLLRLDKYEIPVKDIQYKEGVLEFLNENPNVDILIISEILEGEIEFKKLITNIIKINKNIEIIVFVEEESKELNHFLYEKGIFKIYKNNQLNIQEMTEILDSEMTKNAEALEKEIKKLKQIIEDQKFQERENTKLGKVIAITGSYGTRKKYAILYTM